MTSIKQFLLGFTGGLFLLCIWLGIVVLTSQDFVHEGPNSSWFTPIDEWSRIVAYLGWSKYVSSFSPGLGFALGILMLLGPFVLVLSAVSHLAIVLMRKVMMAGKLK